MPIEFPYGTVYIPKSQKKEENGNVPNLKLVRILVEILITQDSFHPYQYRKCCHHRKERENEQVCNTQ